MTNLEKYKDKIIEEIYLTAFCFGVLKLRTGKDNTSVRTICGTNYCKHCQEDSINWLAQKYTKPKKINFTQDELTFLKSIDIKYNWIARNLDGELCVYDKKPIKLERCWIESVFAKVIYFNCFKQIKWKDKEPVLIDDYVDRNK